MFESKEYFDRNLKFCQFPLPPFFNADSIILKIREEIREEILISIEI